MIDRSPSIARLQFLGAQRIEIGSEVVTPEAERLFGMIVRLSVPLGRITSRQTMLDTLWPGADEANARHNLRQTVYKAREIGLVVESGEDGLRLDPRHWSCDWDDPVGDVGGEWLADYEPEFSEQLTTWITAQRVGVHGLVRPRIIRSLQTARSAGELVVADRYARQLLGIDELNEEATLTCAELMAMQGAKVDALKLLDTYLTEIGRVGSGKDAALPAQLLRRRIAEKLPAIAYHHGSKHHGPLIGRHRESKRLFAALVDARAGRGGAVLLQGGDGTGKSRLLYEMRKSAVLQGMLVLEMACDSLPSVLPFANLRSLTARLLAYPGAMGVSPEALTTLQAWIVSQEFAPDDCPLSEIEDLLAAVADETPLLLLVEHAERMDRESLGRLDRVYRRGLSRYHVMVLTTSTLATPTESPVDVQWLERLPLRPMNLVDVRSVVTAYAAAEQPRATQDQIACAAVFAEGIPMYGIEMLGLMLDAGSPDVIPWRVQTAVDRQLRELNELQLRVLTLCGSMRTAAFQATITEALRTSTADLASALEGLEARGHLRCDHGILIPSELMALAAEQRVRRNVARMDALQTANLLSSAWSASDPVIVAYVCLELFVRANEEVRAYQFLDSQAGDIVRRATSAGLLHELQKLKGLSRSEGLNDLIDAISTQVEYGSTTSVTELQTSSKLARPSSLPPVSLSSSALENSFSSSDAFDRAIEASRDPNAPPGQRMTEAVMALAFASNTGRQGELQAAFQCVNAVRHAPDVNRFDVCRADLIFLASTGDSVGAIAAAYLLADQSRIVSNVELACKGLRNSAMVLSTYGVLDDSQSLLFESRALAARLEYAKQVAAADIQLADLAILEMDCRGAEAYLAAAARTIDKHRISTRLLKSNLHMLECWAAVIRNDRVAASKSAKVFMRAIRGGSHSSGTALWAALGVKLATSTQGLSQDCRQSLSALRSSIGTTRYYPSEHLSMTALLLATKGTSAEESESAFISSQIHRIEQSGRGVWRFLLGVLDDRRRLHEKGA